MNNKEIECYIHIPFCLEKCSYCDFLSFKADEKTRKSYIEALLREIVARAPYAKDSVVSTVFFGGGTPSCLEEGQIACILNTLKEHYGLSQDAEISIEANPCTVTEKKLEEYLEAGINRISVGCQSTYDSLLKKLGRLHDMKGFVRAMELIHRAGFKNINADLMFAIPDQTCGMWRDTLEDMMRFDIRHISAYSLILEEGTRLYDNRYSLNLCSEDDAAVMYEDTAAVLGKYGFKRYEISNYAKEGFECRHNSGYWTGIPYMGFGLGASSYEDCTRFRNTDDIIKYNKTAYEPLKLRTDIQKMSDADRYSEYMILGLRMTKGVSVSEFKRRFDRDIFDVFKHELDRHLSMGTLALRDDNIYIPERYLFVSNGILSDFI